MIKNFVSLMGILLLLMSCSSKTIDYNKLSSFDENNNLRAVIEIPSGTNDKLEYRAERNSFEIDSLNGHPRVIEFLPYLVNYGFIPSTNTSKDSKADPLDILVYGKPFKTGQIVSVKPIGILKMLDEGEEDDKVLCIPIKKKYQIIDIKDFQDLSKNYPTLRNMISDWFLNYDKNADIQILGWFDESKALRIVDSLQS
jgi:inorganic pyrophosphatase